MRTYDTYKDSGIAWLGQIPSHWELLPGFSLFYENKEKFTPNSEHTVLSLSYGNIVVKKNKDEGLVPENYNGYQVIKPGHIVIRCTDLQNDKVSLRTGLARDYGIITGAYLGIIAFAHFNAEYLHYFLHDWDITKEIYRHGSGLRQSLSWNDLKRLPILVPTQAEQEAIVNYLKNATAKIDEAIAQQQKMIDLLKERKQIIINEAVTHGLDPNVPMKQTGIDWLPQIPAHWDMRRLKYAFQLIGTKSSGNERKVCLEHIESWTGRILDIDVQNDGNGVIFEQNDILFGKLRPYLAKVYLSEFKGQAVGDIYVLRCEDILDCKYAHLLLICKSFIDHIDSSTYGTKMPRTNWTFVGNTIIPIPPKKDQINIVNKITSQLNPIDKAIKQCERMIELLTERKQILINDVVTGKIMVS